MSVRPGLKFSRFILAVAALVCFSTLLQFMGNPRDPSPLEGGLLILGASVVMHFGFFVPKHQSALVVLMTPNRRLFIAGDPIREIQSLSRVSFLGGRNWHAFISGTLADGSPFSGPLFPPSHMMFWERDYRDILTILAREYGIEPST